MVGWAIAQQTTLANKKMKLKLVTEVRIRLVVRPPTSKERSIPGLNFIGVIFIDT